MMRSYLHTGQIQVRSCTAHSLRCNTEDRITGMPLLQEVAGGQGQHEAGLGADGVQAVLQARNGPTGQGFMLQFYGTQRLHAGVVAGWEVQQFACSYTACASLMPMGHSVRQLFC